MARKWFAVILIAVGVILTLDVTGTIAAGDLLGRWWPLILITLGIAQLLDHPEHFVAPTILMVAGGVFLLSTLDVWTVDVGELIGPVILIGVGASILIGRTIARPLASRAETGDLVDSFVAFGGRDVASRSDHFRGGSVVSLFGGTKVDLRQAHPGEMKMRMDVTSMFGGTEILIPEGWDVDIHGLPIFGGFEDKTAADVVASGAPVLDVHATALFGGVEIKH
jgi:predicted membrane protein